MDAALPAHHKPSSVGERSLRRNGHAKEYDAYQDLSCWSASAAQRVGGHARAANAEVIDGGEIASHVVPAIAETVKKQVEIGIDCINDGEFWTARSLAHYAAHFTGLEARPVKLGEPPTTRHSTRERDEFRDFYSDMDKLGTLFFVPGEKPMPPMAERVIASGPVKSRGPQAINREIDAFRAAIDRSGSKVGEAFIA